MDVSEAKGDFNPFHNGSPWTCTSNFASVNLKMEREHEGYKKGGEDLLRAITT